MLASALCPGAGRAACCTQHPTDGWLLSSAVAGVHTKEQHPPGVDVQVLWWQDYAGLWHRHLLGQTLHGKRGVQKLSAGALADHTSLRVQNSTLQGYLLHTVDAGSLTGPVEWVLELWRIGSGKERGTASMRGGLRPAVLPSAPKQQLFHRPQELNQARRAALHSAE